MNRGVDRRRIFVDPTDYAMFERLLAEVKARMRFELHAYALMPNHFHLLVREGHVPLWRIMQELEGRYAQWFNARHDRTGHLYGGRYKDPLITTDEHYVAVLRYVHLNPVEASLVSDPAKWRWSGHAELLSPASGGLIDWEAPLAMFGKDLPTACQRYADFVHDGIGKVGLIPPGPPEIQTTSLLFERRIPRSREIAVVLADVARAENISEAALLAAVKRTPAMEARKRFVREALNEGHQLAQIARFLGISSPSAHRLAHGSANR